VRQKRMVKENVKKTTLNSYALMDFLERKILREV
jgi:hypothetical protein